MWGCVGFSLRTIIPSLGLRVSSGQARASSIQYRFRCNNADMDSAACTPDLSFDKIEVVCDLEHIGGTEVVSRSPAVLLCDYLEMIPEPTSASQSSCSRSRSAAASTVRLVHLYPWFAEAEEKKFGFSSADAQGENPAKALKKRNKEEKVGQELDDEAIQAMLVALDKARADESAAAEPSADDFKVTVLGGAWTLAHHGVPFDAIQGGARSNLPQDFCNRRGVPRSARFNYSTYGDRACGTLERAWCH